MLVKLLIAFVVCTITIIYANADDIGLFHNVMATNNTYHVISRVMLSIAAIQNLIAGISVVFVIWFCNFCTDFLICRKSYNQNWKRLVVWLLTILGAYFFQVIIFQLNLKNYLTDPFVPGWLTSIISIFKERNLSFGIIGVVSFLEFLILMLNPLRTAIYIINDLKKNILSIFRMDAKSEERTKNSNRNNPMNYMRV